MGEKKEFNMKSNKGISGMVITIIVACLIPIIVVALVEGIIGLILEIVQAIIDFIVKIFTDPGYIANFIWTQTKKAGAALENTWSKLVGLEHFNPEKYKGYIKDPEIVIPVEKFNENLEALRNSIDMEAAGLDNETVANLLCIYLSTTLPTDYTVKIFYGTTETEYKKMDGKVALKRIYKNGSSEEMLCVSPEGIREIYAQEYLPNINADQESKRTYALAVKEFLAKCYTAGAQASSIQMYAFNEESLNHSFSTGVGDHNTWGKSFKASANFQEVDYGSALGKYATPLEFMVTLMTITGSNEFLDAFSKTVDNITKITVGIYDTESQHVNEETVEYDLTAKIFGKEKISMPKLELVETVGNQIIPYTEKYEILEFTDQYFYEDDYGTNQINATVKFRIHTPNNNGKSRNLRVRVQGEGAYLGDPSEGLSRSDSI